MCESKHIRRRQHEATTTVSGRLPLIPVGVGVMAATAALFVSEATRALATVREGSTSASWIPSIDPGSHLVALSCDQPLIQRSGGSAILPMSWTIRVHGSHSKPARVGLNPNLSLQIFHQQFTFSKSNKA